MCHALGVVSAETLNQLFRRAGCELLCRTSQASCSKEVCVSHHAGKSHVGASGFYAHAKRHVSLPGPKITGAELWSMGGDGIVVDGAFALVVAVDANAQTLTLAMDSAAAPCALAELCLLLI